MKKSLLLSLATTLCVTLLAADADAFGRRNRGGGCGSDCGPSPCYTVSYVPQQVTCYQPVWKTKKVTVPVTRVSYKHVQEPVEYYVCEMKFKDVERDVISYQTQKVPFEYYECVPKWTDSMQTVVSYKHTPQVVMQNVTTCQMVPQCVVDPCIGCTYTVCRPQMITRQVQCTVYKCEPVQQQVPVKVCTFDRVKRVGERLMCQPVSTKQMVKVCYYENVKKQGTVTRCIPEYTTENVEVDQRYCEWVQTTTTVNVAVCTPCQPAPCGPAPCGPAPCGPAVGGPQMNYAK